jgi:peroxiredoxin
MRIPGLPAFLLVSVLLFARSACGDERFLPGHSHYGEVFDRGPRQSAYLMGGTGNVHLPVSSKNPLVQKFIDQGVGQLHGFWFVEAERSFRKAAELDPNCGIAYWGMSVANEELHPQRAKDFAAVARKHKNGLTDREKMYIDALGSETGYRAIIAKYPADLEAKAFEVWRIWHKSESTEIVEAEFDAGVDLAYEILAVEPMHPIHHALIHINNAMHTEGRALDSAAKCGETAPSIGHMWHMPTHIYFELRRYPEAAWQLEASIRTEHARMMHDRVLPDQVHLYAHNNEWLVRALLHLGRVHDARRTAMHMIDLPRHPLLNLIETPDHQKESGPQKPAENDDSLHAEERVVEVHGTSAYYGRDRLLQVLRQYEYWPELIEACQSGYIDMTALPAEQGKVHLNLGIAHYCQGDVAAGDRELAEVEKLLNDQATLHQAAADEATRRPERESRKALNAAEARYARPIAELNAELAELKSYQAIDKGFFLSRTMLLVSLVLLLVAEVAVFWRLRRRMLWAVLSGVGAVGAGVWLFLCHLALLNLPYESVNVDFGFMSRKQLDAGDADVAEWCAREYAANRPYQVRPQANLVDILYRIGKKDDARTEFETLRELAGTADLDSPPLARLAPIAREFDYPTDWRRPEKIRKTLAGRRPLESLGPLVWRPWSAPDWKLKDAGGRQHTLAEFHGKPLLMIFFLGRGCLHCKQQLEAFVKRSQQLSAERLTVVAVSTDDEKGVTRSLEDFGKPKFPFLMLADPKSKVFQAYRAYDDFEKLQLHGTILIDSEGFVRWHDEGAEPFMDVDFVLAESKRLLSRSVPPVEPGARVIADAPASAL